MSIGLCAIYLQSRNVLLLYRHMIANSYIYLLHITQMTPSFDYGQLCDTIANNNGGKCEQKNKSTCCNAPVKKTKF